MFVVGTLKKLIAWRGWGAISMEYGAKQGILKGEVSLYL
jgi:hypothetical protein